MPLLDSSPFKKGRYLKNWAKDYPPATFQSKKVISLIEERK